MKNQIGKDDRICLLNHGWHLKPSCYMCRQFPGVETFMGIKNDELGSGANHHAPEFDLDEDGLTYSTAAAVSYVLEYFENTPDTSCV